MTPQQIDLVQDSFSQVAAIKAEAAALFYTRLFQLDPALRRMFPDDLRSQGQKLMAAIGFVVGGLSRLNEIVPEIQALARRHVAYGVHERHYATVGEALLWTLQEGLGARFTPSLREAWASAYALLSGAMIAAAAEAEPVPA